MNLKIQDSIKWEGTQQSVVVVKLKTKPKQPANIFKNEKDN